jgi:hypothetical protein
MSLSASDQATPGTYPVVVTNPSPGGGPSNAVNLTLDPPRAEIDPIKGFEAAVSYSQSLTQWALLLLGGTVLLLLGTSYYRPGNRFVLYSYLLFVPSWGCLGVSMWHGTRVAQAYLAYLWFRHVTAREIKIAINHDLLWQGGAMECALAVLTLWMLVYLYWWIKCKKTAYY